MKSKFLRILALILVMSSLLSMFVIFASAAEPAGTTGGSEEEENEFKLIYHRTYDEGWDALNGVDLNGDKVRTRFDIDSEINFQGKYNYFWRLTLGTTENNFIQIPGAKQNKVGSVIEFDFMTDDLTSLSNPVIVHTKESGDSSTVTSLNLFNIENNKVKILGEDAFTMVNETWYRIQLIFDYTEAELVEEGSLSETFKLTVKYGPADGSSPMKVYKGGPQDMVAKSGNGIRLIRFQSTGGDANNLGNSLCFDNVKYYEGVNELVNITGDMGYGSAVKTAYAITEEIKGDAGLDGGATDLNSALSMKVGVNYCYANRTKSPIFAAADGTAYGAPVKQNGKVMVPLLTVLKYMGYEASTHPDGVYIDVPTGTTPALHLIVGKSTANMGDKNIQLSAAPAYATDKNGNSYVVIALDDISKLFEGYYSDYDEMGYMVVGRYPDMLDRSTNLTTMVSIMKEFVFDYYDGESLYNDVKEHTNFEHPYILTNAEQIRVAREEYLALEELAAAGQIVDGSENFWKLRNYRSIIENADWAYSIYAKLDANGTYDTYNGLLLDAEYPDEHNGKARSTGYTLAYAYASTGGYDEGGRSPIANRTQLLEYMAQGYILNEDTKYLELCYEVAIKLGEWEHWGPGHFLNCADSANDFAIYYDWTYQGYLKLIEDDVRRTNGEAYDVKVLAEILARQGVHEGYLSTNGKCDHVSDVVGVGGASYSQRTNNWAAVCVGGMTVAALAIFDGNAGETYLAEAKDMVGKNLRSLLAMGMDIYAPDGAYIEGPGYWNYGTNNYFRMCAALDTAAGTNYGLMDCWGIDTTCYYACHTEDNNSQYFPFHDGSVGSQDTSYFFYVADYFNDATLYDVRLNQINSGTKRGNILDMLYYPRNKDIDADSIQLDYYSENIDLFATRASWEKDALFASIIGGKNKVSHGQMDAGDFVYHNAGNIWIYDLGTENYNCTGFWPDATRYRFYVMKPEGNNTVAISTDPTTTPYGQLLEAEAKAYNWGSNEYGSFVTYDMGNALGKQVESWERGMLLTNDRKTTVIQDQIDLKNMQTVYWFAHYNINIVDGGVTISSDGRTAYMRDYIGTDEHGVKQYKTLRLTIVSENKSFKFTIMNTYQFIHTTGAEATYSPDVIASLGGAKENDRSQYRKLAINSGNVLNFNVAVVIELVDDTTVGKKTEIDVGYTFQNMAGWEPTADMRGLDVDTGETVERRPTASVDVHLLPTISRIQVLEEDGTMLTEDIKFFFKDLADAYYAVNMLTDDIPREYAAQVNAVQTYRNAYAAYRKAITEAQKTQQNLVNMLMGL